MNNFENPAAVAREEVADLLSEMEAALLELENAPHDPDLINRVFRSMHSIKGTARMFGFEHAARLTHELESVYQLVRDGLLPPQQELWSLGLAGKDLIWDLFGEPDPQNIEAARKLMDAAQGITGLFTGIPAPQAASEPDAGQPEPPVAAEADSQDMPGESQTWRITMRPRGEDALVHLDPLAVMDDLRALGDLRPMPQCESLPLLGDAELARCDLWWDMLLTTSRGENAVQDVLLFVGDYAEVSVRPHEAAIPAGPAQDLGGEPAARTESRPQAGLRVDAAKLDDLVSLVGEMVIAQAQLNQAAARLGDVQLTAVAEDMERLSSGLRDHTLSLRMQPIGVVFERFRRLVRDLAQEQAKEIRLETHGAGTELDKTVVEQLGDCLAHLMRNSIDHGLETPGEREAAGKPRQGRITLTAGHSGGSVMVRIADDGRGLNREAIGSRAKELGLMDRPEDASDTEVFDMIFHPGFSTARAVTDLSGRGVGMDAVKASIESMRGSVELASEQGRGATVTVKVPLTLAIIEGLLVRVDQEHFVVPLAVVQECVELANAGDKDGRGSVIDLRGEIVPYVRLREWFQVPGQRPALEQIIITGEEDRRTGIVVDEVVGQQQAVIKSLGRVFQHVEEISGATVRGDGTMALILDVDHLVRKARWELGRRS